MLKLEWKYDDSRQQINGASINNNKFVLATLFLFFLSWIEHSSFFVLVFFSTENIFMKTIESMIKFE